MVLAAPLLKPSWVFPSARFDFDFANGKYYGAQPGFVQALKADTAIRGGNIGPSYNPDITGIVRLSPAGVLPVTNGYGLWCELNTTNSALQSRDFTQAVWVKVSITAVKNQQGADLTNNGASLLTATALNATVLQSTALASAQSISSAYVKRISGTGPIYITQDNGVTLTQIDGLINSSGYTNVATIVQTLAAPTIGFQIATSGDAIAVDFFQQENNTVPTGPQPATTVAVSRGVVENLLNVASGNSNDGFRVASNIFQNGSPYTVLMIGSGSPPIAVFGWWLSSDGSPGLEGGANGTNFLFKNVGTATTPNTGNAGIYNINKVIARVNGQGATAILNGGQLSNIDTLDKAPASGVGITHCGIGNNGAGNGPGPLGGFVSRMAFWNQEVTDGQMQQFTM